MYLVFFLASLINTDISKLAFYPQDNGQTLMGTGLTFPFIPKQDQEPADLPIRVSKGSDHQTPLLQINLFDTLFNQYMRKHI